MRKSTLTLLLGVVTTFSWFAAFLWPEVGDGALAVPVLITTALCLAVIARDTLDVFDK